MQFFLSFTVRKILVVTRFVRGIILLPGRVAVVKNFVERFRGVAEGD
jgi:hypothetical protein